MLHCKAIFPFDLRINKKSNNIDDSAFADFRFSNRIKKNRNFDKNSYCLRDIVNHVVIYRLDTIYYYYLFIYLQSTLFCLFELIFCTVNF